MPVPTHFKFTVRGIFLNSPETWSFGFHMSRKNQLEVDAGMEEVHETDVSNAVAGLFGTAEISNKVEVSDWRCYIIGTDGKMEGNGPKIHLYEPGELRGVSSSPKHPPQIAVVISTLGPNRGPAKHGRFFLPGPTVALDDDWRMGDDEAAGYRAQATTFLKAVSDSIDLEALNSSEGLNISPGPPGSPTGTFQVIDHIEVGRALDTLRNRRKSLLEEANVGGHIDW